MSGTSDTPASNDAEPTPPESSWQRLISLTAMAIPSIRPDDLPASLRRFAKFTPHKRRKLASTAIRKELAENSLFRQRIGELVAEANKSLVDKIVSATTLETHEMIEAAAIAYLLRTPGWQELVTTAYQEETEHQSTPDKSPELEEALRRLTSAEHDKAIAERELEKLRAEITQLRDEAAQLRRQHKSATAEARQLKQRERKTTDILLSERGRLKQAEEQHAEESHQLKSALDKAVQALDRARRGARDARSLNEARLWLLLETISGAATGLRRELALEPTDVTPADITADIEQLWPDKTRLKRERALDEDDPIRLNELLALPQAHMIVDGYNVTIGGFGDLPLEQQRSRLLRSLSGIAAQTGAEVTVVFDGAERLIGQPASPRGVRVLFSRKGQIADDVIRALVRAEPNGRPIIVISSDKEVAHSTRRLGAYPLPSSTLLRRMDRS